MDTFTMMLPWMSSYLGSLTSMLTWVAIMNPWALACLVLFGMWMYTFLKSGDATDTSKIVKQLVQSSAQWNSTSLQDSNAILSLMHANYAVSYMNVARTLASDDLIEKWTHSRLDELVQAYQETQSKAIASLNQVCPTTMPPGLAAVYTGWITK